MHMWPQRVQMVNGRMMLWSLVVLLFMYVASFGPACWAVVWLCYVGHSINVVYWPMISVLDYCPCDLKECVLWYSEVGNGGVNVWFCEVGESRYHFGNLQGE